MKTIASILFSLTVLCFTATARGADNKLPEDVAKILAKAEQIELLSLDPDKRKEAKDSFHGYKVLGKTALKDAETRKKLVEAFTKGTEGEITPALCFIPRHGLRITHDGKTAELVICFQCAQFHVYDSTGKLTSLLINKTPEPMFDQLLKDAGIPKAK